MKRAAFTLIELLVVISIIALLIAILLPALAGARASARLSQCQSNQSQFGKGIHAYAAENKQDLPSLENWYTLAGPAGSSDGAAIWPVISQVGLGSEVGANGVTAPRAINDYLGDSPEVSRCPDDKGDAFFPDVENCYEAYGNSYLPQWKDGTGVPYFGVAQVFGAATLDASGNRSVIAGREPANMDAGVRNGGVLYRFGWSKKILMGDIPWHGNRPLADSRNRWHLRSSANKRLSTMLFGDGHVEYFEFPNGYGPLVYPVDPSTNGYW
ncbi:prepilin-type N-terminal cleavage/methylation domain-containing protein [Phycisphaeraceae bacterium D3-23]